MSRKQTEDKKRNKLKRTHYFDADLWKRLQAFVAAQQPAVTDSAVLNTALRQFLDAREKRK